jgi:hypothetical protein
VASSKSPLSCGYRDPQHRVDPILRSARIVEAARLRRSRSAVVRRAAHYISSHKEFSGIVFPTKRRTFPRQPDGHSVPEPLVVSIDPLGLSKSLARSSCQRIPNMSDRRPPVSVFWTQPLVAAILNTSDAYRWLGGLPQDEIFSPCSLQKKNLAPKQPAKRSGNIVVAVNSRNESNHL